jgi:hypothetical protein
VLEGCARVSVGSAKGRTAELRSLLGFLFLRRFMDTALADSVPSVAGWRNTEIAATIAAADVERLLGCCDRFTLGGAAQRRDHACAGARLGLRRPVHRQHPRAAAAGHSGALCRGPRVRRRASRGADAPDPR